MGEEKGTFLCMATISECKRKFFSSFSDGLDIIVCFINPVYKLFSHKNAQTGLKM